MLSVSADNLFSEKKTYFLATAAIKQQRQLYRILGGAALVAAGEMRLQSYDANGSGGGYRWRKTS